MKTPAMRAVLLSGLALGTPAFANEAPTPAAADVRTEQPNCLRDTGSHIQRKDDACVAAPGQVLTREELQRSGGIDTADAIRRLSTTVR